MAIMRLSDSTRYMPKLSLKRGPAGANSADLFHYIDLVRTGRAAGEGVVGQLYQQSEVYHAGRNEIIQTERLIELAFEGHCFGISAGGKRL